MDLPSLQHKAYKEHTCLKHVTDIRYLDKLHFAELYSAGFIYDIFS